MKPRIELIYRCQCMSEDRATTMIARGKEETIEGFMYRVRDHITKVHRRHSPECTSIKMDELKIPIKDGEIGRP